MAKSSTRKKNISKKVHVMTVPQLRKAFEQINIDTKKILSKHPINDESIKEFQKCWKQVFHKNIDSESSESYLQLQSKMSKHGGSMKKTRKSKQKGGVAPIEYTLRPGIDGTHGNYLPYVSSGLSFYDNINQIAMDQDCGKINTTPNVDISMGSNEVMKGGVSLLDGRVIASSVPSSILQDVQDYYIGKPLGASPNVLDTKYKNT